MKNFLDRWFWAILILAIVVGLFLPWLGKPFTPYLRILLGGILFFSALRLEFQAAWRELRHPGLGIYATVLMMTVAPFFMYALARPLLPRPLAVGVLILTAMPSGMACSALSDLVGGNPALALVVTLLTCIACPITTPWVIELGTGVAAGGGLAFLLQQAGFLALTLFIPLCMAALVRLLFPSATLRYRSHFQSLSMLCLFWVIVAAMAAVSTQFRQLLAERPILGAKLFGFMCIFSALLHIGGYLIAPWRPLEDRAALSVNMAYVNNALGIVFAMRFFSALPELGMEVVLPAIMLEITMSLMLAPLKLWVGWKKRQSTVGG